MSLNLRVPGGWVGTRSAGVRAGPLSIGTGYRSRSRRRSSGGSIADLFMLLTLIVMLVHNTMRLLAWITILVVKGIILAVKGTVWLSLFGYRLIVKVVRGIQATQANHRAVLAARAAEAQS